MPEEKKVAIINQGPSPMDTEFGRLLPDHSIEVTESLAKKLTGAYKHIKYAKDIVPAAGAGADLKNENAALRAQVKDLGAKLEAAGEDVAALQGRLKEFLEAKGKDLKDLQEKHAEAVPA